MTNKSKDHTVDKTSDRLEIIKDIFIDKLRIVPKSIIKINIGFSTDVYNVDNKYIIRINKHILDIDFKKCFYLFDFFRDKIPCPEVLVFDDSKTLINQYYGIYKFIEGENLYARWHCYTDFEKENIVKQICNILKTISDTRYIGTFKNYNIDPEINWRNIIYEDLKIRIKDVRKTNVFSKRDLIKINKFIEAHISLLDDSDVKLVHADAHFDNFIVKDKKIVGVLDFDSISYKSIDYPLYLIKRLMIAPNSFNFCVADMKLGKKKEKDYDQLLVWFKKYYLDMCNYEDIDSRLSLYLMEKLLKFIPLYPRYGELYADIIRKLI